MERFHRTLRREFLNGKVFDSIDDAQAQLDAWVEHYDHHRPHQGIGMVAPWERFRLAAVEPVEPEVDVEAVAEGAPAAPTATRKVDRSGNIGFASAKYRVGRRPAGEVVTVVCDGGLVQLHHRGALVATHARRHRVDKQRAGLERVVRRVPPRPSERNHRSWRSR